MLVYRRTAILLPKRANAPTPDDRVKASRNSPRVPGRAQSANYGLSTLLDPPWDVASERQSQQLDRVHRIETHLGDWDESIAW